MKLCNFSNTDYHLEWYGGHWHGVEVFLKDNKLDGIELLLHGNRDVSKIPEGIVKGLHLSYFPTWLEFYNNDIKYKEDFPTKESIQNAFGGTDKSAIKSRFKKDFEIAKRLKAEYMVYHVGHVTLKDAFTYDFSYSNEDVLNKTVEIVNETFIGDDDVTLLFENLWWPGLTLLNKEELDTFMEKIDYKNKGVMLDLSHLLITNKNLKTLDDGVDYILNVLEALGDSIHWIKGIHINSTAPYAYLKKDQTKAYQSYKEASLYDQYSLIYEHISSMDQHKTFSNNRIKEIIEKIKPIYQMIEVVGHDKYIWESYIKEQLRYLNDI